MASSAIATTTTPLLCSLGAFLSLALVAYLLAGVVAAMWPPAPSSLPPSPGLAWLARLLCAHGTTQKKKGGGGMMHCVALCVLGCLASFVSVPLASAGRPSGHSLRLSVCVRCSRGPCPTTPRSRIPSTRSQTRSQPFRLPRTTYYSTQTLRFVHSPSLHPSQNQRPQKIPSNFSRTTPFRSPSPRSRPPRHRPRPLVPNSTPTSLPPDTYRVARNKTTNRRIPHRWPRPPIHQPIWCPCTTCQEKRWIHAHVYRLSWFEQDHRKEQLPTTTYR